MSGGAVLGRASDEFVGAVEVPDEAGGAEAGDGGGCKIECVERTPVVACNFHADSMAQGVGHWRSKAKSKREYVDNANWRFLQKSLFLKTGNRVDGASAKATAS